MSFVIATPELLTAAAGDLGRMGLALSAPHAAAAASTTRVLSAGADEVSAAVAAVFGAHAQNYQSLSAQAADFHTQFVRALSGSQTLYASAEATNLQTLEQDFLNAVNAPSQALFGRPLIANGGDGGTVAGAGQPGGPGGLLIGNGGGPRTHARKREARGGRA